MRFADQNKTKFATSRGELEGIMKEQFSSKLLKLLSKSEIARNIEKSIEDRLYNENIGKIKKAQKQSKRKISDKFSPATKYKNSIYLTEGDSAKGSILQARDSETEAIYALKGKVKNTRRLSDLSDNKELLEIMSILNIEPGNIRLPVYDKIIIASDEDFDGHHIASLLVNFFYKWFPQIIKNKQLYRITTPLVVCTVGKERKYFYTLSEYEEFSSKTKVTNANYLKGLGSLDIEDWKYVMQNKILFSLIEDRSTKKFLEMAFSDDSSKRKKWLQGE